MTGIALILQLTDLKGSFGASVSGRPNNYSGHLNYPQLLTYKRAGPMKMQSWSAEHVELSKD